MTDFLRKNFGKANPFVIAGVFLLVLGFILISSRQTFAWTNLDGGDHGGADWTPSSGDIIAGVHTNIGTFTINPGATVYVKAIEPTTVSGALLRKIYAGKDLHPGRLLSSTAQSSLDFAGCQAGYCEDYSVRFTGQILTTTAGIYTFYCASDDGCRLWVNGMNLFNGWYETVTTFTGTISLDANTWYDIVIDYFQGPQVASFNFDWQPPGGSRGDIPPANMRYYAEPPGFSYGSVEIQANVINIAGTLTSAGAGFGGGGGGGGGGCTWGGGSSGPGWYGTFAGSGGGAGSNDGNGWPGICGGAGSGGSGGGAGGGGGGCSGGGAGGGGGAGPYGGSGGAGGTPANGGDPITCTPYAGNPGVVGNRGGYATSSGQGDLTTDESVNIGSGGGGGGGGGVRGLCSSTRSADCSCGGSDVLNSPAGGGGAGGRGGGSIKLIANTGTASLSVSGSVIAAGTLDGGNAFGAGCNSPGYNNAIGGLGFSPGSSAGSAGVSSSGAGASGGGGAGGGVLLKGKTVNVTGSVNNLGGGSSAINGGTIKIFYQTGSWVNLYYGRLATTVLPITDAPTNMAGTAQSETTIRWTWNDNSPAESNYQVYNEQDALLWTSSGPNVTSWDDNASGTGLTPGVVYSRYAKACNSAGCSAASNTATSSTWLQEPVTASGQATAGTTTAITWSWSDSSSKEQGYRLYECITNNLIRDGLPADSTSYIETGLTAGNSYCRYVKAFRTSPVAIESSKSPDATAIAGGGYVLSGSLESATFDTQIAGGATLNSIIWQGSAPAGSQVDFQIASSNSLSGPWTYVGKNCTTSDRYYNVAANTPQPITQACHFGQRYFRYKIYLSTTSSSTTPIIDDVIIGWSP